MLHLVKLALSKPYTFVVLAILILLSGTIAWFRGAALAAQNQIVPAGTTKIGQYEYNVRLNGLHILAYNIKRAIALIGVPNLMTAMRS